MPVDAASDQTGRCLLESPDPTGAVCGMNGRLGWQTGDRLPVRADSGMKKLLEILVCFLHPIADVDRPGRRPAGLGTGGKLAWGIFGLIPFVPFLYVLTGGDLW